MSSDKESKVAQLFKNLEYGPAPESPNIAYQWMDSHDRKFGHFINGKWINPGDRKEVECKSPATGEVLASTIQGTKNDLDIAVQSAKTAYESWSSLSGHARARYIYSIARHVQKHMRLISVVESLDNGKPIRETRDYDIPIVVRHLYHHAGWAELMETEMKGWISVGVVGAIVPWNFPLMLLCWKVCPALAMGNTVVLKPASYTRLSALLFADICAEAGLPAGVFNVVTGDGRFGSALATHPDVDKVGFTGSTEVGKILRRVTAGTGKKLSLELGGKSPIVVFDTADLDSTVEGIVMAIWFNQGQVCSAGSRLLVQETVAEKLIHKLKVRMKHLRVGNSLDKCVDIGAIVDDSQRKSVDEYVEDAKKEGAEVYQASECIPDGCFYPPTLVTNLSTTSKIVIEEVFGPVLAVLTFRTAKEAIALANNTLYGLGASVWSEHIGLAMEVACNIKAGSVWINNHNVFDAATGFGGYKESGYGRDGGKEGLYEYVKPSWQPRIKVDISSYDVTKFGAQAFPTVSNPNINPLKHSEKGLPKIDRTLKLYIGGKQVRPDQNFSRPVLDCKGSVLGQIAESNRKDVRNAVEAANNAALSGWSKRSGHNKAQLTYFIAENLELRKDEFVRCLIDSTSCSVEDAEKEVDTSIQRLFHWAAYADKYGGNVQETEHYGTVLRVHEAVGVVAIACPDEAPLLSFLSLLIPAFIRGNTTVIVPSEKFPLPAVELYQILETSDVPPGVINILTGSRDHITKILAEHQNVNAMWYFGSSEGSKFVEHTSAVNIKRVWVNYGQSRDWYDRQQGCGEEFLIKAVECKSVWIPMGHVFAN
ncbi:aldehyde dehydrogenase family 16 member A1-like [Hydractinia symbiolongicarpus]|uniref:aldehyde dehydrogenase family 16 member A1-like n=1 Tax=Hydractinia symbiolongicarpus TaxID=13093 RepID=UPI00255032C1|nr:aldehyde dehydrogenase family 16 member A1-like [Hydractinia symbiolongicarpus]